MSEALIHLEDVKKVFLTDEVETHALAGIHMQIAKGEYALYLMTPGAPTTIVGLPKPWPFRLIVPCQMPLAAAVPRETEARRSRCACDRRGCRCDR